MSDFTDFLNKVLAPIRSESKDTGATESPKTADRPSTLVAISPVELEKRYVEVMNALMTDAREHSAMHVFSDVVTWKIAVVAFHCGPHAAGDILRRIGAHMGHLAEVADAEREAEDAKKAGMQPN